MHPGFGETGRLVAFMSQVFVQPPRAPPDYSPTPPNLGGASALTDGVSFPPASEPPGAGPARAASRPRGKGLR